MSLSEFDLIRRYFEAHNNSRNDVVLGVGDDAALVTPPLGRELVLAIDTLVAGVHFPLDTTPFDIGYKLLAVNLSDLAAMGSDPAWITLALTLPQADEAWLQGFADGLFSLADRYGVALIGGDTTRGPLTLSLQAHGSVPTGTALRRSGAEVGDRLFVTGALGGAALGLQALQGELSLSAEDLQQCRQRLDRPEPRVAAGQALRGLATAAVDISDGLIADLGHITAQSGVGAQLNVDALPLEPLIGSEPSMMLRQRAALSGGDDFELCFTLPAAHIAELEQAFAVIDCGYCEVGEIVSASGVALYRADGSEFEISLGGYDHFSPGEQ